VAILEKMLQVEEKMFDSVALQNEADASHSDAECEKCKAEKRSWKQKHSHWNWITRGGNC